MFEPVGYAEIGAKLKLEPETIRKYRRRYEDFPVPVMLKSGPVWNWPVVAEWCASHHRPNVIDRMAQRNGRTYEEEIAAFKAGRAKGEQG